MTLRTSSAWRRTACGILVGCMALAAGCSSKPTILTIIQNFNQKNYPKVVEQCRQVLAGDPNDIQAHRYLIRASKRLGTLSELEAEYRQKATANPQDAVAAFGLGYTLVQDQRYEEGFAELQRAENLNPQLEYVNYVMGWLHFNPLAPMHDVGKANEYWQRETELDAASMGALQVYIDLGNYYKDRGEFELARQQFRLFRDNAFSEGDRIEARNLLDTLKEAELEVVRLEQAANDENASFDDLRAWGERLIKWERAVDAIPYWERAVNVDIPTDPETDPDGSATKAQKAQAYNFLGMARMLDNQNDAALEAFHKAVELDPELAEAYYNMGFLNDVLERWDVALEAYEHYLDLLSFSEQAEKVRVRVDEIRAAQAGESLEESPAETAG